MQSERRYNMIKKIAGIMLAWCLMLGLAACGSSTETGQNASVNENPAASEMTESSVSETEAQADIEAENSSETAESADSTSQILVVYFSATGTTEGVAETLATSISADLYEINPVDEYTEDDLNYNDNNSRSTTEQNDASARPEISGTVENWDAYDTVFIGYPIWWSEEPRIMDTFVESYDFTDKTAIPFCTSGGSGIGRSGSNLEELANGGTWLEGERLQSSTSDADIAEWINDLGISIQ